MHTLQQLYSGELKGTKHLKLSCGLSQMPEEIFSLAESLEILDLSKNQLSSLPDDFGRFSKLKILFLSDNLFTELPEVLSDCAQLEMIGFKSNNIQTVYERSIPSTTRWLILTNNSIKELPASIGNCVRLQKVGLAGNRLSNLPNEMEQCKNLELLRISANNFTELPLWLLNMPKLSWLAFAGNPFSKTNSAINVLNEISFNEFEILEQLGEGASGNIYKAAWKKDQEKKVAIKIYKGEVTSDGFPEDEIQACISAGAHPHLVKLAGKIKAHPQNKQGLVMELIPPSFYNLGMPPDLNTCSRDTFKENTFFKADQILKIAIGIASVSEHLHKKSIMHGDLYAHNILIDDHANSLMSDFGAASFYDNIPAHSEKLQKIESRAFGCLLDDLLTLVTAEDKNLELTRGLISLKEQLMQLNASARPLFTAILTTLKELENLR